MQKGDFRVGDVDLFALDLACLPRSWEQVGLVTVERSELGDLTILILLFRFCVGIADL